jgi:diguanylate cyclase (GGDEF)-like protein/PAS domain S-box-containing protein
LEPWDPRVHAAMLEFASEFLLFTDQRGGLVASGGAGLATSGFAISEALTGRHIAERIHPDDLLEVLDLIERARVDPNFRDVIRARALGDDGRWRVFEATVIGVARHPVLGTGAVIRARMDESVPAGAEDRFSSLAAAVPHGVLSGDARGWVVFANEPAREMLGLEGDAVFGEGWRRVVHPDDEPDLIDAGRNVIRRGTPQHATFRVVRGEEHRWLKITIVPLGPPERRTGWVGTLEDTTDRLRARDLLAHQATHDDLTGLPNRALLDDRLALACTRRRRGLDEVSVLFVDLDGFKEINDSLGHATGDEVLRVTAARLRAAVRPQDTVARLGGDEFVVLLDGLDHTEATRNAADIEATLGEPITVEGHTVAVVASVGVATAGPDDGAADLVARADAAMYRRKHR